MAGRDAYDELLDAGARIFEYLSPRCSTRRRWSSTTRGLRSARSTLTTALFQLHDEVTLGV